MARTTVPNPDPSRTLIVIRSNLDRRGKCTGIAIEQQVITSFEVGGGESLEPITGRDTGDERAIRDVSGILHPVGALLDDDERAPFPDLATWIAYWTDADPDLQGDTPTTIESIDLFDPEERQALLRSFADRLAPNLLAEIDPELAGALA